MSELLSITKLCALFMFNASLLTSCHFCTFLNSNGAISVKFGMVWLEIVKTVSTEFIMVSKLEQRARSLT